ncbi:hypothetical protein fugu_011030 [Takifugu bimaculatus]|nr:hypothetical protein fugu_011030 [Takifugu bimaculatus]
MGTRMEVMQLESRMDTEDYRKLQGLFKDPSGAACSLSRAEFIGLAWPSVGRGSRQQYSLLFDSVVACQEGHRCTHPLKEDVCITWGGLCSFLLLQLSDKIKNSRIRSIPSWKPPQEVPCPHRDPVQKVLHLQTSGQYLTVSKGGTVVLWDGENMSPLHTQQLQNSRVAPKDLWVTDVVVLSNINKVAVSFTSKEVYFYDMLAQRDFSCQYKLQGLKFTLWCLDYWAEPSQTDRAVLTIGDIGGQVSALYFTSANISLFERLSLRKDSDSAFVILWDELRRGRHRSCYTVTHQGHMSAWVRKVRYLGSMDAFASCSSCPQSSLVIGWREEDSRNVRLTTFATKRGVWDMDHHCGLNLIATAGLDHRVLLWNPCVMSEPVCLLRGHTNPITAVCFIQSKQELFSYSKDKVLCLWDLSRQLCLYRLTTVFPKMQEEPNTLLFLQEE